MKYFISGIGTEVGKTVTSAFLCKALGATYWKPVQAGELQSSDTLKVQQWATIPQERIIPERYRLNTPASPHFAAREDALDIQLNDFELPEITRPFIVEGAGGLLVPLNERHTMLDLIERFGLPVILVARNYLGSINHTLLSISALQQRNIPIAGIIYSGANYRDNEEIIQTLSGVKILASLPELEAVSAATITELADRFGASIRAQLL